MEAEKSKAAIAVRVSEAHGIFYNNYNDSSSVKTHFLSRTASEHTLGSLSGGRSHFFISLNLENHVFPFGGICRHTLGSLLCRPPFSLSYFFFGDTAQEHTLGSLLLGTPFYILSRNSKEHASSEALAWRTASEHTLGSLSGGRSHFFISVKQPGTHSTSSRVEVKNE